MSNPPLKLQSQEKTQFNLAVLKRNDAAISDILKTVSYAVVYDFDDKTSQWTKKEIEGPLFIVKRSSGPANAIFVLNRMDMDNLNEPVVHGMEFQNAKPFLMMQTPSGIIGLWFHNTEELDSVHSLLTQLASQAAPRSQYISPTLSAPSPVISHPQPVPTQLQPGASIPLHMLFPDQRPQQQQQQQQQQSTPLQPGTSIPLHLLFPDQKSAPQVQPQSQPQPQPPQPGTSIPLHLLFPDRKPQSSPTSQPSVPTQAPQGTLGLTDAISNMQLGQMVHSQHSKSSKYLLSKTDLSAKLVELSQNTAFIDSLYAAYVKAATQ